MVTKIFKRGYFNKNIYTRLLQMVTNFNALLTKIDVDLGDTAYNTAWAITFPADVKYTASRYRGIYYIMELLSKNINLLLAALDLDDGVDTTTYGTNSLTDRFDPSGYVVNAMYPTTSTKGAIVVNLKEFITAFAATTALLKADSTLSDTDYDDLDITDDVEA